MGIVFMHTIRTQRILYALYLLTKRDFSKADFVKDRAVKLVLQPMTKVDELRKFLSNGFDIKNEYVYGVQTDLKSASYNLTVEDDMLKASIGKVLILK